MRQIRLLMIAVGAVVVSSCATTQGHSPANLIDPAEAIQSAATAAPQAVRGRFAMRVQAVGRRDGNIYLNSEEDYRDQRNLTVTIRPSAINALAERFGDQADRFLIGKRIVVDGEARRVQIDFTYNGQPTGKYYYQTHVDVREANQLSIASTAD
jgi:hypothetical protein